MLAQAEMYAANNRLPDAIRLAEQALRTRPRQRPRPAWCWPMLTASKTSPPKRPRAASAGLQPTRPSTSTRRCAFWWATSSSYPTTSTTPWPSSLAAEVVRTHPREAKAYSIAGDVQILASKKLEGRNNYLKALRYDKSKYQLWQQVVALDAELNQPDSVLVHTDRALELFPNQASLWFYNGLGYLQKKQPQKAVNALEHGRKLALNKPDLLGQFDAQLGDAYQETKDYAKSDAAYDAALTADPNNYGVLNNYSYYLSLRGEKLDKAKEMAGRTVKQFPDNDTYLDTYAWVLYKQKDYAGARPYLERAAKATKDASILEHYGDVLWQLGDHPGAVAAWQHAQKAGRGASPLLERKINDQKLYE